MPEDKVWDRITDAIDTKYGILDHGRTKRNLEDKRDLTEHVSFVTFKRSGQEYKLERIAGPAIIDRKTVGSKRIGSDVRFENIYDPTETSFRTNLYRQEAGEWVSVNPEELGL